MERWQLAIQYHPLWFAGAGGFDDSWVRWPAGEDTITPHINIAKMWWQTNNQNAAEKYNELYVKKPIKIYLWYDNTTEPTSYYQDIVDYKKYKSNEVSIDIEIPTELKNMRGEWMGNNSLLCNTETPWCDIDGDSLYDDTIIQRDRKGQEWRWVFTIIPYTNIDKWRVWEPRTVDYNQDTNLRESIINIEEKPTLLFTNTFNPIAQNNLPDAYTWHNISWGTLSGIQSQTFTDLLTNNDIEYNIISLSMISPGIRRDNIIYPYMHYKINGDNKIASTLNTIQAYAQTHQNNIRIQATKPNMLTQQKWSFSISTSTDE